MDTIAASQQLGSYALLTDGSYARIRRAVPDDWQAVRDFAQALGEESLYRGFFEGDEAALYGAMLAFVGDRMAGLAEWRGTGEPGEAEIAFAVRDDLHGRGLATLLAEYLIDTAHRIGIRRFTAVTQAENHAMLDVLTALGVPAKRTLDDGTWKMSLELDFGADVREVLLEAKAHRERIADGASMRSILDPRGVAVIGDALDPATRAVRANISGFEGEIATAAADGSDLPADVPLDLAVITSPPASAVAAARVCAQRGVRAVAVTSTGFDAAAGRELLAVCRAGGMRLIGPGSLGVANPGGGRGLNATLARQPIKSGFAGVAAQSGGVGLALISHLSRLGIGISSFAVVGEKYDVSANDLLMHWERNPGTKFGLVHVESFGNPRKFARTARRLSRRIPLFAVDPEQSPSQARTALYAQAGITAVPSLAGLVATATLVAHQPEPRGARVAVLGNTRGMVSLATAACLAAGLDVVTSVDVAPDADAARLHRAMASAAQPDVCDALLVALAPTASAAPVDGLGHDAVPASVPLLAVLADQPETVAVQQDVSGRQIPCYNDAAVAAAALRAAVAAAQIRTSPLETPAEPDRTDRQAAQALIDDCLAGFPRGRTLYASERTALLDAYGIRGGHAVPPAEQRTHAVHVIAWQDPTFGPLLTCTRDADSASAAVLLVPTSARNLHDVAARMLDAADPSVERLADVLARVAALVDDFARVTAVRLTVWATGSGAVRVQPDEVSVAPGERVDPYLRRLRRAPIE